MAKLRKYNAEEIYKRVAVDCPSWSLKMIEECLEKHGEKAVDALWIAKRKDILRKDKLWILIKGCYWDDKDSEGLAPGHIRKEAQDYIIREWGLGLWYSLISKSPDRGKKTMRFLTKLLEKENAKKV